MSAEPPFSLLDMPLPSTGSAVCAQCGAPMEAHDRFCPACGGEQPAEATVSAAPAAHRHLRCQNCGAEVSVDPNQRSYACAFCESTYVVEFDPAESGRQPPEFVIGFAVTLEQAQSRFVQWLHDNSWFRPSDISSAEIVERLRGVYLPFWSFSMLAESRWSAQIGEYWYRTETYTTTENGKTVTRTRQVRETEWWPLGGGHHRYYSGYLVSASRGLPHAEGLRIQPFHLAALKRYQHYFLAGWTAEEYSVVADEALRICQEEFSRREQANIAGHLPGDTHSGLSVESRFSDINSDLILLPVYLLSYRYQNKLYRFLMNGQTGKLAGDKPISGWRIAIAVGLGLAALLVVALLIALLGN
jgi:DNA-directed RNA polymerase subunit RPC12/RpoP